ncbi:MAG: restriction endonuclease [Actinomycetota bacterium]
MIDEGVIAVGGEEIGDLSCRPSLDDLKVALRASFPDRSERALGIFVGYWRAFLYEMTLGDLVALSISRGQVAIGRVLGDYEYRPRERGHIRHVRQVDWLNAALPRDRFDEDMRATLNSRGTICRIHAPNAAHRLEVAAIIGSDPGPS